MDDIDSQIMDLVTKVAENKVVTKQPKLIKRADVSKMPDLKKQVEKMHKDGYTTAQMAAAFGYEEAQILFLLDETQDMGTPEQILQESLKTLWSLVPLAESTYRNNPSFQNSLALTGFIDSTKGVISELYQLKDKEEIYRVIVQKVVEPTIRGMISDMMVEFRFYSKSLDGNLHQEKLADELQKAAMNIGKKFDEAYRRANELLANIIGLNADAKARVLASLALSKDT